MTNYKLNEEKMFADITDGVAIIINGETGIYYGMNGFGTSIFENLIKGASTENILNELKKIPEISPDIENRFNEFVNILVAKELVIPSEEIFEVEIEIDAAAMLSDGFDLNVNEYNDAQELLLADPIHEVKEETGWSPEIEALNPDMEDVARRELKMEE
ncbi:MAG: hypothetical protein K0R25_1245 [Rickettsiaceae bacterium]|jgi:hypothetical protein|nr:hypothetical protein [Rickettsiaceae bacterium]